MKNKWTLWALAAVLVMGFAAAEKVHIMWSGAITGPTSDAGKYYAQGIEDYCNYINDTGYVAGVEFVCEVRDDQYNNANTLRNFEEAVDRGDPIFLGYSTGGTLQLKPLIQEVGLPFIPASYHIGNIDPPDNDYIFLPIPSYSEQVIAILEYIAKATPGAKVAMVVHPSPFGRAPVEDAKKAAAELGITIVEVQEASKNLDNTATLKRFENKGVQYIVYQNVAGPVATMIKDAQRLGLNIKHAGAHYAGGPDLLRLAGPAAEGFLWVTSYYMPDEDNDGARFVKELGAKYGRPADTIESVHYPSGMLAAAIAIEAIKEAKDAGKKIDPETVYQALLKMDWPNKLAVGPVTYSKDDHVGVDMLRVLEAKDGRFVPITEPFSSQLFRKVHYGK
ncbi:ABC transporter substrate-binding protein [Oceanithermus sp.]|uniref:ABC transporter substrate-binding protein n=1 Tax=Oceanithermus sp. TaxID=2268145 RepID=UPI0025D08570|nr:ABC transporter substrate-binding protein [Oceanithermus sp.]